MFRLSMVSRAALLVCMGSIALGAMAQTQTDTDSGSLKRIEITGSRIKRVDSETASAVQVITREQIERSGATSVTDVMKSVPANNAGAFDESAVASFTPGAGGVSLRGLGAQATLILINGRRVAPFGFASGGQQTFVDVNSIPLDAVERIETLLDGASAIYGSDAIAGVVNIILRKDFTGFTGSASYGITQYKDAKTPTVSLTVGHGSLAEDKYNVFANFSHSERSAVYASDRPTTSTADQRRFGLLDRRSSYAFPGNLYTVGGGAIGSGAAFLRPVAGCTPVADGSSLNGRCVYDAANYVALVPQTKKDSLLFAGTMDLGGGNELFGDASFTRNTFSQQSNSYSTSTYQSQGTIPSAAITLPIGHPQNPYTDREVAIRYRFQDVPSYVSAESTTQRVVAGLRGTWWGWDAETGVVVSRSNTDVSHTGFLRDSVLVNEVLDADGKALPTFQFGNPCANNASLMSRLYPTLRDNGTTQTASIDLHGSRDLMQMANGPLSISVGTEIRNESFASTPDALTAAGEISVLGASSADGKRNIGALYTELSIPLFKTVEAQLAARMDHYSDFGTATTPKAAIKWKVLPNLAVRATYSEGFRAPALTETSSSPASSFYSGIRDPKTCPVPDTTNLNCDLSINAISGSNPNLKPERSKSMSFGIVFEPIDNISVTLDTYNIKRTDEISGIDVDYLLAHEGDYPGYVQRLPDGTINKLNLPYTNLGSTHVMGYDLDIKSRFNIGEYGKLTLQGSYNAEPTYQVANVAGATEVEYAGTYGQPKQRFKLGAVWDKGPWTTSATWNHVGDYLRAYTPADLSCSYSTGPNPGLCKVDVDNTVDMFIGYKGIKNLDLGLTITNVGNVAPPIDERNAGRLTLLNSAYSSALGRNYTFRAKYNFW
ncbi:MAG: TonB-dependent receptor [Rhodoferax sp.]